MSGIEGWEWDRDREWTLGPVWLGSYRLRHSSHCFFFLPLYLCLSQSFSLSLCNSASTLNKCFLITTFCKAARVTKRLRQDTVEVFYKPMARWIGSGVGLWRSAAAEECSPFRGGGADDFGVTLQVCRQGLSVARERGDKSED